VKRRKKKELARGAPDSVVKSAAAPKPHLPQALALAALAALTVAAFSNSFGAGFILDNQGLLLDPRIRHATAGNLALIFQHSYWWPTGEAGLYRPFTTLSYLFNYAVLGNAADPSGYHGLNLLLHLANVFLAFAVARRLFSKFWPSFFAAALWAVHPVLTESVTNIVGRADLLAGAGVLGGFLLYLKSRDAQGWSRIVCLVGLAIATAIGVFSKESAVVIGAIIIFYEFAFGQQWKAAFWGCVATLVPIGVMLYERAKVLAASSPAEFPYVDNPIVGADWWTGRLTAVQVMLRSLLQTVWPARLSCDYSYNAIPLARGAAEDWLALSALLAVAAVVALAYRFNRAFFFFGCFAFLNFLPASNLLFPIGTIRADRLLYLPSLGVLACLVLAIYSAARRPKWAWAAPLALSLLAIGFAGRTWMRNQDWNSELAIAKADLPENPGSFKLHELLASALFAADRSHLSPVIAEQEKSLAVLNTLPLKLRSAEAYRMAGYYDLLESRQHPDPETYRKAIAALETAVSIPQRQPDPQAHLLLSVAELESGDAVRALPEARLACSLDPTNLQTYRQLSSVYLALNDRPQTQAARNLEDAIAAANQGNWPQTKALTESVLNFDKTAYPASWYFLGVAELRLGDVDAAEKSAREAVAADRDRRNPSTGYLLGLILARKGNFGEAAVLLRTYLQTVPAAADADVAREQLRELEAGAAR